MTERSVRLLIAIALIAAGLALSALAVLAAFVSLGGSELQYVDFGVLLFDRHGPKVHLLLVSVVAALSAIALFVSARRIRRKV